MTIHPARATDEQPLVGSFASRSGGRLALVPPPPDSQPAATFFPPGDPDEVPDDAYDEVWDLDDPEAPMVISEEEFYDADLPPMSAVDQLEWELWASADQDEAERFMLRQSAPDWVFLPPGGDLAAALGSVRVQCLSPMALIEYLKAASRLASWAEAMKAAAMATFFRQRKAQETETPRPEEIDSSGRPVNPERSWAAEVGAALHLSPNTAVRHIETALHLTGPLAATFTALRTGALSHSKALAISEATRALSDDDARAVESHVLRRAASQTHANLRRSLRHQVAKHQADVEADRHREAVSERTCKIVPLADGMAGLWIVHTADNIQKIWVVVQALADLAKRPTPTTPEPTAPKPPTESTAPAPTPASAEPTEPTRPTEPAERAERADPKGREARGARGAHEARGGREGRGAHEARGGREELAGRCASGAAEACASPTDSAVPSEFAESTTVAESPAPSASADRDASCEPAASTASTASGVPAPSAAHTGTAGLGARVDREVSTGYSAPAASADPSERPTSCGPSVRAESTDPSEHLTSGDPTQRAASTDPLGRAVSGGHSERVPSGDPSVPAVTGEPTDGAASRAISRPATSPARSLDAPELTQPVANSARTALDSASTAHGHAAPVSRIAGEATPGDPFPSVDGLRETADAATRSTKASARVDTAAESNPTESDLAKPNSAGPNPADPNSAEPRLAEPNPAESDLAKSNPAKPNPAKANPAKPNPVESNRPESNRAELDPADPKPAEPNPADSKPARDERTAEQRRADSVADLFGHMLSNGLDWLGRRLPDQHRRRPHIEVLIPVGTLLSLDDEPCELTGYGPIPAEMARRIAADGTWRRLLTDPENGVVLNASTTRHDPSPMVSETLLARHPVCAWPGCNRSSRECDRDHGTPFAVSGRTSLAGLAPYCEYHHVIKDTPRWGWRTENHPDGSVTLIAPTGHRYTTVPPARGPITRAPTRAHPGGQAATDPPPF
ncbi:DUF222 domain-containing protein [Kribbella sp. NPDC051587]|uniref:HNH endonuclease signature motif containing protein n=1 Tax=Kribbella sp. NPDC051587 TaxID=3364119 RepID=UPI003787B63E